MNFSEIFDRQNIAAPPGSGETEHVDVCVHCGDICGSAPLIVGALSFCCSGCRAVYDLLSKNDLCEYYAHDARAGVSMRSARTTSEQFVALDERSIQLRLLSFESSKHARIVWTVPTLHCASCIWLLEQLGRLDHGVMSSQVDIMRKSVTIDFDPRATTLRNVAETMASIGYAPIIRLEGDTPATSSTRKLYARIGVAGFAAGNTMLIALANYFAGPSGVGEALTNAFTIISILLSIPVLLYSASPWFEAARASLRQRRISLEVPVAIGISVLFIRSMVDVFGGRSEGYLDSFNGLVLFLLVGRLFQQKAFDALSFDRTYRSFFPLSVRVERDRALRVVPVEEIQVGETMLIRNGEVIPCDAVLRSEAGYVDYSFVTGESMPVECTDGALVYAGGRVVGRSIRLIATKTVSHSQLAQLWDRTAKRAPRTALLRASDAFGKYFTFFALALSVVAAIAWLPDWEMAFNVFTAVLIIACPCAMTLAAPITLGTAMGRLGSIGIYLRNVGVILELDRITSIFFDKTGTLTTPSHALAFLGRELSEREIAAVAAVASQSSHPISRAIASSASAHRTATTRIEESPGEGIAGNALGHRIAIGSMAFIGRETGAVEPASASDGIAAAIAIDGLYAGAYTLRPEIREGMSSMIEDLAETKELQLLSGDSDRDRGILAPYFGTSMHFRQRPEDKIAAIERARQAGKRVLMVGDGLNDAGAMSEADVAIAVTDDTATLVPACDAILRAGSLRQLPALLRYTRSVRNIIIANFIISIVYNAVGLSAAVSGILSPLFAAVLMPVSSLTVIGVSVAGARLFARRIERLATP